MVLFYEGKKLTEYQFKSEKEFESNVLDNSKLFFGNSSIYIDAKKKIDSKFLGSSIPDGFLFDLSDIDNPEFYIVEVELTDHDFYKHIFPQLTKFFSFLKNPQSVAELVDKIFNIVNSSTEYKRSFKSLIGKQELYKFIKDTIENSRNVLLILDGDKDELPEIMETYTDTWGSILTLLIIKKFKYKDDVIYSVFPDFKDIQYVDAESSNVKKSGKKIFYLTEEEKVARTTKEAQKAFYSIKEALLKINNEIILNPQKYYLSVSFIRNIAFFKFRRSKIRLILMLPEELVRETIKNHPIVSLSASVQKFYNGPSCAIDIIDDKNIEEIIDAFKQLITKMSV